MDHEESLAESSRAEASTTQHTQTPVHNQERLDISQANELARVREELRRTQVNYDSLRVSPPDTLNSYHINTFTSLTPRRLQRFKPPISLILRRDSQSRNVRRLLQKSPWSTTRSLASRTPLASVMSFDRCRLRILTSMLVLQYNGFAMLRTDIYTHSA